MTTHLAELERAVDATPGWHETTGPLPILRARAGRSFDAGIPPWAEQPFRAREGEGWSYFATSPSLDAAAIVDLAALIDAGFDVRILVDPATPDPPERTMPLALAIRIGPAPSTAPRLNSADDAGPAAAQLSLADVAELDAIAANPEPPTTAHVPCATPALYVAHQTRHRQRRDGSWTCDVCAPDVAEAIE